MRHIYKSLFVAILYFLANTQIALAQSNAVAIGTATPDATAVLLLVGNGTQGLIIPTTNLTSSGGSFGKAGMIVYNTADSKVYFHNGTQWTSIGNSGSASQTISISGNQISVGGVGTANANLSSNAPSANQFFVWNGSAWTATSIADVTNVSGNLVVSGVQGKAITLPSSGVQYLSYDATQAKWIFQTPSGSVPTLSNGQILTGNGTSNSAITLSGDGSLNGGTLTINKLSTLTTNGLIKTSGGTGALSIATSGTDYAPATTGSSILYGNGSGGFSNVTIGSNLTFTAGTLSATSGLVNPMNALGDIIYGGASGNPTKLAGAAGFLKSTGAAAPAWSSLTATDIPNLDASKITTGTLPITNGGTGATTASAALTNLGGLSNPMTANGDIIYGGASGAATRLAGGAAGILKTNGTTPSWGSIGLATTDVSGTLPITNGGTGATTAAGALTNLGAMSNPLTTTGDIIYGVGSTPTRLAGAAGFLKSTGAVAPTWSALAATDIPNLDASKITTGTLPVTRGGTGITTATNGQLLIGNGAGFTAANLTAGTNISVTNGAGSITINSTGLGSTLNSGNIFVGSAGNVATGVAMSGDATLSNTGALTIGAGAVTSTKLAAGSVSGGTGGVITDATITDADVSATAAISGSKVNPAFGTQNISTTGTLSSGAITTTNLASINSVPYAWPSAQGAASTNTVLTNDGTGTLSWAANNNWGLTGNSGTNSAINFIGTTDNMPLIFKVNGAQSGGLYTNGSVHLGISSPTNGSLNVGVGAAALSLCGTCSSNTALGASALTNNSSGTGNTAVGMGALNVVSAGNYNTAIGFIANVGDGLTNATAIGYQAFAGTSNSLVLGSVNGVNGATANTNVGIGTSNPAYPLDVVGNFNLTGAISGGNNAGPGPQIAYGNNTTASGGYGSMAVGYNASALGTVSLALGQNVTANGYDAVAIGQNLTSGGNTSVAIGNGINVSGDYSVGIGLNGGGTTVTSPNTMAIMGGNVGIGTVSPSSSLHVYGTSGTTLTIDDSPGSAGGAIASLKLNAYGNVLFGGPVTNTYTISGSTVLPFLTFSLNSTTLATMTTSYLEPGSDNAISSGSSSNRWTYVYAANGTIQTSDLRLKSNIVPLKYGLSEVLKFKPVSYTWKEDEKSKKIGLIAQEVKQIVPEVVVEGKYLGMNYSELVPVLIKAVQEQQQLIDEQKKQIAELKQQQAQKETKSEMELNQLKEDIANIKKALGMEASAKKSK